MKISAVIIACNEEAKIADAIRSVDWADEILVIDSESSDRTREIAEGLGTRVIVREWPGFSVQKQFGVDTAVYDWIFSLDADERVSDELKAEILATRDSQNNTADGYKVPRLAYYLGRPIRHGGWYPDRQLRFFDRRKAKWKDVLVHESIEMTDDARVETFTCDLLHYSFDGIAHHNRMIDERYAPLAAQQMFDRGKVASPFEIAIVGPIAFLSTYVLKLGILDGFAGLCIAWFAAHHAFLKYALLWEMQKKNVSSR